MRVIAIIPVCLFVCLFFPVAAAHAQAPTNGFCVKNLDDRAALFIVDAGELYRAQKTLAPGESSCTPEFGLPINGFVSVFYDENAVEGCSRITNAGTVQVLLEYADFDNCTWQISP